ncbi:MAG: tripartite tricarboxylate transporter substrate binding protein [Paucimonas sp.]|nr:tripartite tricarboxylate transporter substrate binding protein [Paucimonas sp.]
MNKKSSGSDGSRQRAAEKSTMSCTTMRRKLLALASIAAAALALPGSAFAQDDYPSKPIKLIVPYATGGVSDAMGRMTANALTKALNQTVVVENRGGAGGTLGAAVVAKSAPDGYTLLLTSPPMVAVAPALLKDLSYDTAKDFTTIGTMVTTPNVLVVNNDLPVKSIVELVAYAKGPGKGKLSFASAGPGSTGHLSGHILATSTGIEMQHVPYKSSGQAFPDVISGRVSMVFDSLPSTIGHVRAGKVRPILVMSDKRSSVMPDVPTAAESGFPAATMNFWVGIEGPARMPKHVVDKLNAALKTAVATKEMRDQMTFLGAEPYLTTPAEFEAVRKNDIVKYGKLVKDMGLKQE